nr:proton-conducting transporter membrane subunit [Roseomonas sp. GC11]
MISTLAVLLCCLPPLALLGAWAGGRPGLARLVHAGTALVAGGFALLALAALVEGGEAALLLPFGPAWAPLSLALDGLSAWFLLPLGLCGLACGAYGWRHEAVAPARRLAAWPLFLAGMALALLAGDGFTLLLGFEGMSLASWVLVAAGQAPAGSVSAGSVPAGFPAAGPAPAEEEGAARAAAGLYLGFALFGAACLLPAVGLLAGLAGDLSFAALRQAPPQGGVAWVVLALVVLGAGSKAGLVPLHGWLPVAHPVAPAHVSALMSAVMTKVALYVAARLLLDVGGLGQGLGWGVPLLALGAASALFGALRATQEGDIKVLLACSTIENVGLIAMAFGLSALLRAADLGALAALAAAAGLLHVLGHALAKTLLFLVAGEVQHGAGSRRMDRLGGLIHAMPKVALAALAGAAALAALPPLAGFAAEWLLLQALLASWRVGELGVQVLAAAAVALLGMAAALGAVAMLRFWGLTFLGRPRAPRTLGASEAAPLPRAALFLLAGLGAAVGLLPGALLALGGEAVARLSGHAGGVALASAWAVAASPSASAYHPLGLAVLLLVLFVAVVLALRWLSPRASVRGPAWDCGFVAPPPHLPFGDPGTQPSAAGFAQPLLRMLGTSLLAARERATLPPPGDPAPARLDSHWQDPVLPALLPALARWRDALVIRAERLRDLPLRHLLMLAFGTLLALLALLAWVGPGGGAGA